MSIFRNQVRVSISDLYVRLYQMPLQRLKIMIVYCSLMAWAIAVSLVDCYCCGDEQNGSGAKYFWDVSCGCKCIDDEP